MAAADMSDDRPCTCPPMERPYPCPRKFALSECKAATINDPVVYRWRHQKDEVWKYGHQPQHLVPPRGKELIGYYIVQPLYSEDAIVALLAENKRLCAELAHDAVAAEKAAYECGIRKAAAICHEIGEKVMHPTQKQSLPRSENSHD